MDHQICNAAKSEIYRQRFSNTVATYFPENWQPEEETSLSLFEQYTLYIKEFGDTCYCQVKNLQGSIIASWYSIDTNADFYMPISHQNGKQYLLFRQDLYGYSVLDLETGEIFSYFPQKVLDGEEDFIWVAAHYNPYNNMLAVEGCYWACPYDTLLLKWDEPMREPIYVNQLSCYLENFFDDYDGDVDFHSWEKSDLLYTAKRLGADTVIVERISEAEYLEGLKPEKT